MRNAGYKFSVVFSHSRKDTPRMDPKKIDRKLRLAASLFEMAFQVKRFQIKNKFPNLTEKEINKKAYALIERGCS